MAGEPCALLMALPRLRRRPAALRDALPRPPLPSSIAPLPSLCPLNPIRETLR